MPNWFPSPENCADLKLSVVIPTKDRNLILAQTLLAACEALKGVDSEIIVVNDSDTPVEMPFPLPANVRVMRNPKSGVASGRNYGAKLATGSLLLFLDDDMLVAPADIQTTLRLHEEYDRCFINLNWVYPPQLLNQIEKNLFGRYLVHYGFTSLKGWNRGNHWDDNRLFATNGITSQYLSVRKTDFDASGGYNEAFPHAGFEDYEFAKRLQQQGFAFYIYPQSKLLHNETDRQSIEAWLDRRRRGGQTRRVAAELGHAEVALHYPSWKNGVLQLLSACKKAMLFVIKKLPDKPIFDRVGFKLINILLAVSIHEGYNRKN